jgi:hypothetical protein
MLDVYLHRATLLTVALLFGGMLLFSASFAAFLFRHLRPEEARMLIRKAFPPFYLFVIVSSAVAALLLSVRSDGLTAGWMVVVVVSAVAARQVLMPAINRATDSGLKGRFRWLHGVSVLLTLGHIVIAAGILVHMAQ